MQYRSQRNAARASRQANSQLNLANALGKLERSREAVPAYRRLRYNT